MTQISIDAQLMSKLRDLSEPLELTDGTGRVVGWVTPAPDPSKYDLREPPMSEEELVQREKESESYSTAELLEYLHGLAKP
jgi:hypothetical protein